MDQKYLKINPDCLISTGIILITLLIYLPVRTFDFVNFDDLQYVVENPMVRSGLNQKSIYWAFTTFHASNWHPLTWLTHMADCHFFGLNAGQHHINNVILHIFNSVLLYLNFIGMTQKRFHSALVALLFAIHPIHVESVAWISERKDLLSTFFMMLSLRYYIFYVKEKAYKSYCMILLFYILGLMSKPMIVTFPFLLLLLDYWPLKRQEKVIDLVIEKIPLILLTFLSCVVTFIAQNKGGAVASLTMFSFYDRVVNALISYIMYLFHMVWPFKLVYFYPYREDPSIWLVGGAFLLLTLFTIYAFKNYKKNPQMIVGWLWYIGTLVPVIGLVQVGLQAMADRYTYIPSIGIFTIFVWMLFSLEKKIKFKPIFLWSILGVLTLGTTLLTHRQVGFWRDTFSLYGWALKHYPENHIIRFYMAGSYYDVKKYADALIHYQKTIELIPEHAKAHRYMGDIHTHLKQFDQAADYYSKALKLDPDGVEIFIGLGNHRLAKGNISEAMEFFEKALKIHPTSALASNNMGLALLRLGKIEACIGYFRKAALYDPYEFQFKNNLKKAKIIQTNVASTIAEMELLFTEMTKRAIDIKRVTKTLLNQKADLEMTFQKYQNSLKTQPGFQPFVMDDIPSIKRIKVKYESQLSQFIKLEEANADTPEIAFHIACILARKKEYSKTNEWLLKAIQNGFERFDIIESDSDLAGFRKSADYLKLKQKI